MAGADGSGQPPARTAHFDVVLRGYNQRQVNERVTRLEFDLRNSSRARDAAAAQVSELQKLLNAARSELDKVKGQLTNLANSPITGANVTERVRVMMSLAEEEIGDIRQAAIDHANASRAEADRYATDTKATHARMLTELEDRRKQLEAAHQQRTAELQQQYDERRSALETETQELHAKLQGEHESLLAETRADKERVTSEFDRKTAELEERRTALEQKYSTYHDELDKEYDELKAVLKSEQQQVLAEARAEGERILDEVATRKKDALASLDEELVTKRTETEKMISDLESEALIKVDTLTTQATTQAEKTISDADEYATKTRSEADEHATRRLGVASAREAELRKVHAELTTQFTAAQEAVAAAVKSLVPLPEPGADAKTEQFPIPRADKDGKKA
jgi:hypothetical protein